MNRTDIQSVILNFNKNYANSKGYQFTQLVNQQLEIHPNSMVALYTGNLVRKPIVLSEDTIVSINITSQFPTTEQITSITLNQELEGETLIEATISKGHYSKLTFCRELVRKINNQIELLQGQDTEVYPFNGGDPATMKIPYKMFYDMKDGQFFLGLRYKLEEQTSLTFFDNYVVSFEDLNDDCNTSQGVTFIEEKQIIFHRTTKVNDWNSYALGNQPIKGMSYCFSEDGVDDKLESDISFSTCQVQAKLPSSGTSDLEFLYALDNTYFQSKWATTSTVETSNIVYATGNIDVPVCSLGAYFDLSMDTDGFTKQSLMIIVNEELENAGNAQYQYSESVRDDYVSNLKQILKEIDLTRYEIDLSYITTFRWEIYCENSPATGLITPSNLEENRIYYVRFLSTSPYQQGSNQVLFDSKEIGYSINSDMVETGYLFQQIESYSDPNTSVTGGLCPQFFFKNSDENFVVYNPRQNSTVSLSDGRNNFEFNLGINGYNFEVKDQNNVNTSALENILGVSENSSLTFSNTNFNPNNYPKKADLAGLTQLGSDRTRYNIELNLPIKAYNTTESSVNNLGQTRTIIYNTNPVVEDVTNISSGLINASIDPSNIKFLSLNNEKELKLNNIDVSIRRAKTNELAEEITDASIELLIQSETRNDQINVLV
jgi:hypothetical protein